MCVLEKFYETPLIHTAKLIIDFVIVIFREHIFKKLEKIGITCQIII